MFYSRILLLTGEPSHGTTYSNFATDSSAKLTHIVVELYYHELLVEEYIERENDSYRNNDCNTR